MHKKDKNGDKEDKGGSLDGGGNTGRLTGSNVEKKRREGDSNPRYGDTVNTLSKRAPSAARPSLHYNILLFNI